MDLAFAMYGSQDDIHPAGGGFIGFVILGSHFWVSYSFSRPKRRREAVWPSVTVYRLYVILSGFGVIFGVCLAIWDILIASGNYYKALYDGDRIQAMLFMEVALALIMSCTCTVGILLVYHACKCDGPGAPRKRVNHPRQYVDQPATVTRSANVDLDTTAVTWNPPRLPDGEAPPVYTRSGHRNYAFRQDEPDFDVQQPSQWI